MLLTNVENVKQYLGINSEQDDALLQSLVQSASGFIQSWLNRQFELQEYTDVWDGTDLYTYMFKAYPVQSISSVVVNSINVPASSGPKISGYAFDERRLVIRGNYTFLKGLLNCSVTYRAGFDDVPFEIEQACIELIANRYKEKDRIGLQSKGLAGETIAFSMKDMPADVKTILTNYKKVIPS